MSQPFLSIIIPAYNEEQRLPASLQKIVDYLPLQDYEAEVLIVDDGSQDGTVELAKSYRDKWPVRVLENERNRGKGFTTRRGMLEARGEWRLFSDADLSTPIDELEKFWPLTEQGYEVLIGSRALPDSEVEVHQAWYREKMGRTFNMILQMISIRGIKDTQCGFKMFSAKAAREIYSEMTIDGFAFDVEALLRAQRKDYKIAEIPVRWINSEDSRVSILRDSMRMLWDVIKLRFRLR